MREADADSLVVFGAFARAFAALLLLLLLLLLLPLLLPLLLRLPADVVDGDR